MKATPQNVEKLAERKRDANFDFRSYLKMQDDLSEDELDELVHDTARRVSARFDCATCANCCKQGRNSVSAAEVLRLAAALAMSEEDFRRRYLDGKLGPGEHDCDDEVDADGKPIPRWWLPTDPCSFLKDNRCTVYDARPGECRGYPYLFEPEFSSRTLGMIERTFTCPIVYQVFEELKAQLPWRRRGRRDRW